MSAIGIDLGTTNSCAFIVQNEVPKVIINNNGKPTTPSVIGLWNKEEVYIGAYAMNMFYKYPNSIVTGVKYNMGKKIKNSTDVHTQIIYSYVTETLMYNITHEETQEHFIPEELSAMILKALKSYAKAYLDEDIVKAVITVPTYFNVKQREATIAAGKLAGFTEIKLLNESVAAAVAYGVEHNLSNNKVVFVFDFGGGTLDVSIIKYVNNKFDVLAIDGDLHLGGDDVTKIIFDHIIKQIDPAFKKTNRYNIKLLRLCELAKLTLSNQHDYFFDISEQDEEVKLTRKTFDEITNDLFDKVMSIVKRCLKYANFEIDKIDDIVLVGGSSRIPAIQDRLTKFFNKEPKKNINPDEVVAQGASIVAANWNNSGFQHLQLSTLNPHSIGIELLGKYMHTIIPKNSKLPAKQSIDNVCPEKEDQSGVILKIFSGEDSLTKNNTYLGSLELPYIASDPITKERIFNVTLEITDDAVLEVTTTDKSKKTDKLTITLDNCDISKMKFEDSFVRLNTQQIK